MPMISYKMPDGSVRKYEVDDTADNAAVHDFIARDISRGYPKDDKKRIGSKLGYNPEDAKNLDLSDANAFERYSAGWGIAPTQIGQFAKQMAGADVKDEDVQAQRDLGKGWAGGLGDLSGNVASLLLPGGALEQGLVKGGQVLQRTLAGAPRALRALPKALGSRTTAAGLAGGTEGLVTSPTMQGESRADDVALSAATGAVGRKVLKRIGEPVASGPAANTVMDLGIQPTVGQAARGPAGYVARLGENVASQLPVVGKIAQRAEDRAGRELLEQASYRANPSGGFRHNEFGRGEYFREMDDQFEDAYSTIYHPALRIPVQASDSSSAIQAGQSHLLPNSTELARFNRDMGSLLPDHTANQGSTVDVSGPDYRNTLNRINAKARASWKRFNETKDPQAEDLARAYEAAAERYQGAQVRALSADDIDELASIDHARSQYEILKQTGARNPNPTVRDLVSTVEKAPTGLKLREEALFQDMTAPYGRMMENAYGGADPLARKAGYQLSQALWTNPLAALATIGTGGGALGLGVPISVGMSRRGARAMLGRTNPQRILSQYLRSGSGVGFRGPPPIGTASQIIGDSIKDD